MIELPKEELYVLADTVLHTGEIRAGRNSPDNVELELAESLTKKGFLKMVKEPSKKRTWYVFNMTKKGWEYMIKLEEETGFSIRAKEFGVLELKREVIKKKVNLGTLTHEEFTKYSDVVFSIIQENFFEVQKEKNNIVCFKDIHNKPIYQDSKFRMNISNIIHKYVNREVNKGELFKFIFECGMSIELCVFIELILSDSLQLKSMMDMMNSKMIEAEVDHISTLDKTKIN